MKDAYDKHIDYITEHPYTLITEWATGKHLFKFIGLIANCGCLTMIRQSNQYHAAIKGQVDKELTEQIRADERIPNDAGLIELEDLPVFAEWQRKIDQLNKQ